MTDEELEPDCDGTRRCPAPWHVHECRSMDPWLRPHLFWDSY